MTRPSLLLVPGMLNDARVWDAVRGALEPLADLHVAAVDRHDRIDAMATAAAAGMPARFAVAGFSMGGYVALELARQLPGRISGVALLGTSCRAEHADAAPRRRALLEKARADFDGAVDSVLPYTIHPSHQQDAAFTAGLRAMMLATGVEGYARQVQALLHRHDQSATARHFAGPACVIHGRDDRVVPLALGEELAQMMPHARTTWVPDCGHMAPVEQPQAVAAALAQWLASIAATDAAPAWSEA